MAHNIPDYQDILDYLSSDILKKTSGHNISEIECFRLQVRAGRHLLNGAQQNRCLLKTQQYCYGSR
jgi:hypothetical protein